MTTWKTPDCIEQLLGDLHDKEWEDPPKHGNKSEGELPRGLKSIQLYSMGTPNGKKISILLEELGLEYDAHMIDITKNDQFKSGFVNINPNSKIPCIVDLYPAEKDTHVIGGGDHSHALCVFETGSIMLYLAEKYASPLLPSDPKEKAECMSWFLWSLTGVSPMFGNFGHFFVHAPRDKIEALDYGVARYGSEVLRLLSVLDHQLSKHPDGYICGNSMTLADIATYPWVDVLGDSGYKAISFLGLSKEQRRFPNVQAWLERVGRRPAVQRGMKVLYKDISKSSNPSKTKITIFSTIKGVAIRGILLAHAIGTAVIGLILSIYASSWLSCKEKNCNAIEQEEIEILLFRSATGKGYLAIAIQSIFQILFTWFTTLELSSAFKYQRSSLMVLFAFNLLMSLAYSQRSLELTGPSFGTRMTTGECIAAFHNIFTIIFGGFLMITKHGPKQHGIFTIHPILHSSITRLAMWMNVLIDMSISIAILVLANFLLPNLKSALANDSHSMGPVFMLTCAAVLATLALETLTYLFDPEERSLILVLPITAVFHILIGMATFTVRDLDFYLFDFNFASVIHAIMFFVFGYLTILAFTPKRVRKWVTPNDYEVGKTHKELS